MAIAIAWRVAIRLAPPAGAALVRLLKWAEGPGLPNALDLLDRLHDPAESDADLTVALSEARGYASEVATYSGNFEVRRVQVNWTVGTATLLDEDVRVCTWHLIKLSSGTPVATWDAGDFTSAQTALLAFWNSLKIHYHPNTKLVSIKFYREGPSIVPPQPPVYTHEPTAIPGTGASAEALPPQCAISVTEKTAVRKSWGRFYLPAPGTKIGANFMTDGVGRLPDAQVTAIADYADTLYQAFLSANIPAVVYGKALPERQDADGDTIAARPARALSVDQLQVDNLYDVIRSRRYDKPSLRVQRDIA